MFGTGEQEKAACICRCPFQRSAQLLIHSSKFLSELLKPFCPFLLICFLFVSLCDLSSCTTHRHPFSLRQNYFVNSYHRQGSISKSSWIKFLENWLSSKMTSREQMTFSEIHKKVTLEIKVLERPLPTFQ